MFPIHNNSFVGPVTSNINSSVNKTSSGVTPFADISAGAGIADDVSFSAQALFGAAPKPGLPQSSLDFIQSLNADTDAQSFVDDGFFSQSTLNTLRALAQ